MSTKKKTTTTRQPLKPVLFAITRSSDPMRRPIDECLLVTDNNYVDLVGVTGSRWGEGPNGDAVIARKNVLFYSNTDLRSAIKSLNELVGAAYKEQYDNVQALLAAFQKQHEIK